MSRKKILLTGATGYVGSNFLSDAPDAEIACVVRKATDRLPGIKQIIFGPESGKFADEIKAFNPEIVLHLGAYITSGDSRDDILKLVDSNILFTTLLLDALKETDVSLFINTGTFAEYYYNDGECAPAYLYAATKTAAKSIIGYYQLLCGFKYIHVVPYTIYGGSYEQNKVIDIIINSIDSKEPLEMTNGKQRLDFIHVDDVTDFFRYIIKFPDKLTNGQTYHLGTGKGTDLCQVAGMVEKISGCKTKIKWGAREYRPLDIMQAVAPVQRIRKQLGWEPSVTLEEGISRIIVKSNV